MPRRTTGQPSRAIATSAAVWLATTAVACSGGFSPEQCVGLCDEAGASAGTTTSAGDGGSGDGGPQPGSTSDAPTSGGPSGSGDGPKLDVGSDDPGSDKCDCGEARWSYLWVANSEEDTLSKIDTRTMLEDARYATGGFSPSRTSVNLSGTAVAVANRGGGVAKFWARPEFCADSNGVPGLQTSSGKDDVLPFGQDECLAWFTAFPSMSTQRPVAWAPGDLDERTCEYDHTTEKLWTVTGRGPVQGHCSAQGVWVHLLDGATGVVEQTVHIPDDEFFCGNTWEFDPAFAGEHGVGAYGGAVDSQGNLWFNNFDGRQLAFVDRETLDYEIRESEHSYGITVDHKDRVWLSGQLQRFDPSTETWTVANSIGGDGGISQAPDRMIWLASGGSVVSVDPETMALVDTVTFFPPEEYLNIIKGVSVDIDGYVWAIPRGHTVAHRIDPDTLDYQTYDGLNGPYTYSDMTGSQVSFVACSPQG